MMAPVYGIAKTGASALEAASGIGVHSPVMGVGRAVLGSVSTLQLTHCRPSFRVDSVVRDDQSLPVREETVTSTPFGSLRHFATDQSTALPKVLIVPGLAGHFATLVRNTIQTLLIDHDIYVADWHNARDVPVSAGSFGLDDYIQHIIDFLDAIGPDAHLMAVCQPCVPALAAAAVMAADGHPAEPRSLILLAGPVDARINPGRVNEFAAKQSLEKLERFVITTVPWPHRGAGRKVYPGFLQVSGFMGMSPRRHISAFGSLFNDLARSRDDDAARTREFYEEYFAVLDIAAEFYLDTTRVVFQEHDFARGEMVWAGRPVDPTAITRPLLTIEGENDEFCPPGQTEAAHQLCTSIPPELKRHHLQPEVGHYGVFSGSRFEEEIYPEIRSFVASASG
jgi:poly(3-hydroxybutyrate) depolymerase